MATVGGGRVTCALTAGSTTDDEPTKTPDLDSLLDEAKISDDDMRKAISSLVKDRNASHFSVIKSVGQLSEYLKSKVPEDATRDKVSGDFFDALVAQSIVTPPPTYVPASRTACFCR